MQRFVSLGFFLGFVFLGLFSAGAGEPADVLAPRWKLKVEVFSGNAHEVAGDGKSLFFDDFYGIAQVSLDSGKRLRRFKKRDEKGCEDETVDLQVDGGLLFALTDCQPSEEETVHVGPGPRLNLATLRAYSVRDGRLRWMHEGKIPPPVALEGGKVFLLSDDELVALDATTGKQLWQTQVPGEFFVGPAAGGGRVYVQQEEVEALAFDAASGRRLWAKAVPGHARCPAVAGADGLVIARLLGKRVNKAASHVACLSAESGEKLWEINLPGQLAFHQPLLSGETVYLTTTGEDAPGAVRALEARTGREIWKRETICDYDCTPVLWQGRLLAWSADLAEFRRTLVSDSYSLLLLDAKSGKLLGSHRVRTGEKFALSRPVIGPGRVAYSIGEVVKGFSLRGKCLFPPVKIDPKRPD